MHYDIAERLNTIHDRQDWLKDNQLRQEMGLPPESFAAYQIKLRTPVEPIDDDNPDGIYAYINQARKKW